MPPGCFVKSELAVLLRKMGALNEVNGPLGKKKGEHPDLWEDHGNWSSVVNVRRCKTKQTCLSVRLMSLAGLHTGQTC